MDKNIDITPTPRILRTLGEIPFQPWQCIAELIDNSIDAFAEAERAGLDIQEKKITVSWSSGFVSANDREIEIRDTGLGMTIDQLQNAARAGYSSNDPIHNLGLFGMGFNIATARLGEKTRLLSCKPDSSEWVGIEIDFRKLIKSKNFSAPIVTESKTQSGDHGTKVVISGLKDGTYALLREQESSIRKQLEVIYTPLLDQIDVEIYIQGKKLSPRRHCVWGKTRYISRDGKTIPAVIEINRDLGGALFDIERNTYLSRDESDSIRESLNEGGSLPANIIERQKRLTGWIGIQRYSDPNDFGIDFVRNGRKILIGNKSLFSYENPMTGTSTLEYPVELGSTVGGRIVGELHVDYLLPTYQKNDFDKTDSSWKETVEALRGLGPLLPKQRKAMGFHDSNSSPIGLLANYYRRTDPGTKNLFVERVTAKEFVEHYRKGDQEYFTDDKWWEAAQEADKLRATGDAGVAPEVDSGSLPSDDIDDYGPLNEDIITDQVTSRPSEQIPYTSKLDELITASKEIVSWSGSYSYSHVHPFKVKVRELQAGKILLKGESVSCMFFSDGIDCDFIYNPRHTILSQFPIEPRELLALYLCEKFKARDSLSDIGKTYCDILQAKLQDVRIDKSGLQEKAALIFDRLRERILDCLKNQAIAVLECIHESSGETEETINSMLSDGSLVIAFQEKKHEGFNALRYTPYRTLLRIVDQFPEYIFDGNVFTSPFMKIDLNDQAATERTRQESKERIISFLKDALWVLNPSIGGHAEGRAKDELSRCSHSINFLSQEIVD